MGADADAVDRYAITPDCTEREFLAAAKLYARSVVDRHDLTANVGDLDWEVSLRAKRRAGAVTYESFEPTAVTLTWEYFESEGWPAVAATVRHELIHVHLLNEADDPSHGDRFEALAAELDTHTHCDLFAEPKWWVVCSDCGTRWARYRRSKLVDQPDRYACGDCSGDLSVQENAAR
jgi:predicted SprT family Zn-dependent metalloprotease